MLGLALGPVENTITALALGLALDPVEDTITALALGLGLALGLVEDKQ